MSTRIKLLLSALALTMAVSSPAHSNTGTHDNCSLVASAAKAVLMTARHANNGQDYNLVVGHYNQMVSWCNRNFNRCYQRRVQRQKAGNHFVGVVEWELDYDSIGRTSRWSANCTN